MSDNYKPINARVSTRAKIYTLKEEGEEWDDVLNKMYMLVNSTIKLLKLRPELKQELLNINPELKEVLK